MILQISREIVPAKGELHSELIATRETARAREEEGRNDLPTYLEYHFKPCRSDLSIYLEYFKFSYRDDWE